MHPWRRWERSGRWLPALGCLLEIDFRLPQFSSPG
jgi:hypothetical protein